MSATSVRPLSACGFLFAEKLPLTNSRQQKTETSYRFFVLVINFGEFDGNKSEVFYKTKQYL